MNQNIAGKPFSRKSFPVFLSEHFFGLFPINSRIILDNFGRKW